MATSANVAMKLSNSIKDCDIEKIANAAQSEARPACKWVFVAQLALTLASRRLSDQGVTWAPNRQSGASRNPRFDKSKRRSSCHEADWVPACAGDALPLPKLYAINKFEQRILPTPEALQLHETDGEILANGGCGFHQRVELDSVILRIKQAA